MSTAGADPTAEAAQKVFICYRREETGPYAGRIYDAMVTRFGVDNVFMDLDLAPGIDFVDRITRVVSGCVALIVVIGPSWAKLQNEDGTRRIEDPEDFVRLEVETGLRREDVRAIPVLVGGARMPRREDLPPELQAIARRNALEMSEGRWAYDVGRLLSTLDELLPDDAGPAQPSPPPAPAGDWRLAVEGMLVAGVTAGLARLLGEEIPTDRLSETAGQIAGVTARRTETLALAGGALAIWMARRVRRIYPLRHLLRGLLIGALAGLVGGLIWGFAVYAPDEKVLFEERANWDVLTGAISGGIFASLIGWLWRPPRVGPAIVAGAVGGVLMPLLVVITSWHNTSAGEAALSFGLGTAAVTGATLAAMLLADRAERR